MRSPRMWMEGAGFYGSLAGIRPTTLLRYDTGRGGKGVADEDATIYDCEPHIGKAVIGKYFPHLKKEKKKKEEKKPYEDELRSAFGL